MMKRCSIYFLNVIKEIEATFNRSGSTANIDTKASNIMLGLYGGEDLDVIFNIIIFSQSGKYGKYVLRWNITNPEFGWKQIRTYSK